MQKILFFLLSITNIVAIFAMDPNQQEFFNAIKANNAAKVKELIDSGGINIDARDEENNTPLMLAVAKTEPNIAIIRAILDEIPNTLPSNKNGKMAINLAKGIKDDAIRKQIVDNIENALKQYSLYNELSKAALNLNFIFSSALKNIVTVTNSANPERNFLVLAIKKENKSIVKELIKKGADVNQVLRNGKTPLDIAKDLGAADIVDLLINAEPVSPKKIAGQFFDAVQASDNKQALDFIKVKGVDVDTSDNYGNTALMIAIDKNNTDLIEALLKLNANVIARNNVGDTALGLAISEGKLVLIPLLLQSKKFEIDKPIDKDDNTALILAVIKGNMNIINAILNEVPNPSVKNKNTETAVTFADNQIRKLLTRAQDQYNLYKAIYDYEGKTSLPGIEKLLEADVSLEIQNEDRNPLVIAFGGGPDLVKLLITKKPDKAGINLLLRNGKTPLITAIQDDLDPEIVKVLVENGADPELAGSDGRTPLEIATGKADIIKILKEAIAKKTIPVTPPVDNKLLLSSLYKLAQSLRALHVKLTVK